MEQPDLASDAIYDLMHNCWYSNPDLRPTFAELEKKLEENLEADVKEVC
jgi:hypothetical protein